MLEPPKPGFTGTVWEAIPPEQLVQEVSTGPGAAPMGEAALAYSGLAAELGEAATEYRAVLSVLGDAWASSSSTDGLNQLAALAGWLDRTAGSAHDNATLAGRQATAYQIARTTVPHLVEVAQAARAAEDLVRSSPVGALLAGMLDTAEHQLDDIRQQAARAMRSYETASERLVHPWQLDHAPEVSAAANLLAEQSKGTPATSRPSGTAASTPQLQHAVTDLPQLDLSVPQPIPTAPTVPVGTEALAMPAPPLPGTSPAAPISALTQAVQPQAITATPLAPPAPAVAAPAPEPRAGTSDVGGTTETIVFNAGFATAPAVLGANAPNARYADPVTPQPESQ